MRVSDLEGGSVGRGATYVPGQGDRFAHGSFRYTRH
jgi:hypothetical protein